MIQQNGWENAYLWLWYGNVYRYGLSFEKADYYFRKSVSLSPDDSYIINQFSAFLIESEVNVEEGLDRIASVVAVDPDNASYLYTYALGLFKTGNYEEADQVLEKSWELSPYYEHKLFVLMQEVEQQLDAI
jgi:Tfp pilus assembly protein PilF